MSIPYGLPGYKFYKDTNGRIYALRGFWFAKENRGHVNGGDTLSITVRNDARDGGWVHFYDMDYFGYGMKYMRQEAQKKADELNKRDGCILSIPCTVG